MIRTTPQVRNYLALVLLAAAPKLMAQTASTPPVDTSVDDKVIELSPFNVSPDEDKGYMATSTLAGTRIKTDLKDVGTALSVVTKDFLTDTGARNSQDLLVYTTGTEVGGMAGNFAGLGNGQLLDDTQARANPNSNTRVRGLAAADNTRDYFLTDIPWDSFNVQRVDLQRGPNAMLFGMGSPAGIINAGVNAASFKSENTVELRMGSYGSVRRSFDLNHVILKDELSLRFAGLDDDTKYRQRPAFNRDQRLYGALRYDPKFLRFDGARTTIKINYEKGDIEANRPRMLPPHDLITPWWTNASLKGVTLNPSKVGITDVATVTAAVAAGQKGVGIRQGTLDGGITNPNFNPYIGSFGRNYGGIVAVFSDPRSGVSRLITTDVDTSIALGKDGAIDKNIGGIPWTIMSGIIDYKSYAGAAKLPDEQYGIYKNVCLQDPSIFDYFNNLLDGPNKREWSNHNAWDASIEQTFLNNRLGFNFVADKQDYERGQVNLMQDYGQAITLDMNTNLADGSINENFGRACVVSDSQSNNFYKSNRESYRLTGFGELRANDFLGKTTLASILGRHVFMGMLSQETAKFENQSWFRWAADPSYSEIIGNKLMTNRSINTLTYLSPKINTRSSISGAFIGRLEAVQAPVSGNLRHFDSRWAGTTTPDAAWVDYYGNASNQSENPAAYKGWTNRPLTVLDSDGNDRADLVTGASLTKYKIDSKAANWQAYLFDGVFVSTVGVRTDRQKSWSLNANGNDKTQDPVYKNMLINSADYRLPSDPNSIVSGRSSSWSFVLHTPKRIREKMWANTGLSLTFNRSSNFQPAAGRVDAVGNKLAPPNGTTKDVGLVLETLDDRLVLKINWYETKVKNDALQDFGGTYMLPAVEAWGYYFAKNNLARTGNYSGSNKGLGGYTPKNAGESVAEAQARGDAVCNAWMANLPNDEWFKLWGIDRSLWTSWMGWSNPNGFTITGDTKSKGVEYEATVNPTKNWSLTMNASKTSAQRLSMAGSLVDWVEGRWKLFNTPVLVGGKQVGVVGDVQFWGADYNAGETAGGKFGREFMAPYRLYRLQENSDVPELRPWRFNLVSNYNFSTGMLKGVNVGGGYRWQDKIVTGYKLVADPDRAGEKTFDLKNPYMGRAETNVDLWAGYSRKLTAKVNWRVQLNLRNVTTSKSLIPVTVQPDGSMAVGRIPDPYSWTLTNTFTF